MKSKIELLTEKLLGKQSENLDQLERELDQNLFTLYELTSQDVILLKEWCHSFSKSSPDQYEHDIDEDADT